MTLGDFTPQAEDYRHSRPGYPAELVETLVAELGLAAGDPVTDIGAGTGIFTQLLADRGFVVTALEPNEAMRAQATPHPAVTWLDGTFEATGLAAESQRWVVAAQAFHWADSVRSPPELRRVLAPGAAFTALWNNRDPSRSEALALAQEALDRIVPGFDQSYRARDWRAALESTGDFENLVVHRVPHVVTMSPARFLRLWRSNNQLTTAAGPERLDAFVATLGEQLARHSIDPVPVAYVCESWTAWRT